MMRHSPSSTMMETGGFGLATLEDAEAAEAERRKKQLSTSAAPAGTGVLPWQWQQLHKLLRIELCT